MFFSNLFTGISAAFGMKNANKRNPCISAAVQMRRSFEEFCKTEKQLLSNLKHPWKFLFIKSDVVERDSTGKANAGRDEYNKDIQLKSF